MKYIKIVAAVSNIVIVILFSLSNDSYLANDLLWTILSFTIFADLIVFVWTIIYKRWDDWDASFVHPTKECVCEMTGATFLFCLLPWWYHSKYFYEDVHTNQADFQRKKYDIVNNFKFNITNNERFESDMYQSLSVIYCFPIS